MNSILSICLRRLYSARKNLEELLLKMPKDTTEHIQRNQKQRIRIREKSKFYSPGTVNLQVDSIHYILSFSVFTFLVIFRCWAVEQEAAAHLFIFFRNKQGNAINLLNKPILVIMTIISDKDFTSLKKISQKISTNF